MGSEALQNAVKHGSQGAKLDSQAMASNNDFHLFEQAIVEYEAAVHFLLKVVAEEKTKEMKALYSQKSEAYRTRAQLLRDFLQSQRSREQNAVKHGAKQQPSPKAASSSPTQSGRPQAASSTHGAKEIPEHAKRMNDAVVLDREALATATGGTSDIASFQGVVAAYNAALESFDRAVADETNARVKHLLQMRRQECENRVKSLELYIERLVLKDTQRYPKSVAGAAGSTESKKSGKPEGTVGSKISETGTPQTPAASGAAQPSQQNKSVAVADDIRKADTTPYSDGKTKAQAETEPSRDVPPNKGNRRRVSFADKTEASATNDDAESSGVARDSLESASTSSGESPGRGEQSTSSADVRAHDFLRKARTHLVRAKDMETKAETSTMARSLYSSAVSEYTMARLYFEAATRHLTDEKKKEDSTKQSKECEVKVAEIRRLAAVKFPDIQAISFSPLASFSGASSIGIPPNTLSLNIEGSQHARKAIEHDNEAMKSRGNTSLFESAIEEYKKAASKYKEAADVETDEDVKALFKDSEESYARRANVLRTYIKAKHERRPATA